MADFRAKSAQGGAAAAVTPAVLVARLAAAAALFHSNVDFCRVVGRALVGALRDGHSNVDFLCFRGRADGLGETGESARGDERGARQLAREHDPGPGRKARCGRKQNRVMRLREAAEHAEERRVQVPRGGGVIGRGVAGHCLFSPERGLLSYRIIVKTA
ncbi:MAG: hypothetical protein IT548_17795 [Alphaproteobacteria bacterium]|nr:hypothetical protein [Alphaproteobacteria bacterium]